MFNLFLVISNKLNAAFLKNYIFHRFFEKWFFFITKIQLKYILIIYIITI